MWYAVTMIVMAGFANGFSFEGKKAAAKLEPGETSCGPCGHCVTGGDDGLLTGEEEQQARVHAISLYCVRLWRAIVPFNKSEPTSRCSRRFHGRNLGGGMTILLALAQFVHHRVPRAASARTANATGGREWKVKYGSIPRKNVPCTWAEIPKPMVSASRLERVYRARGGAYSR